MNLTAFGSAVRKARIDAKVTLQAMAKTLGVTAAYLSGMEVGRKKVPDEWVRKIHDFFRERGVAVDNLQQLADVSNESVPLKGMNPQQMMMVSGFARARLTDEQIKKFMQLLNKKEE